MANSTANILHLPKYAFWDTDVAGLDLEKNKRAIVTRIFERAKLEDVLETIAYYGLTDCKQILLNNKHLAEDGMYLAHVLLAEPIKKFACYASHRNRRTAGLPVA